jgi:hypothetical protein
MAVLTPSPKTAFVDAAGEPLVGGQLYTYIAGTTTSQTTYTDATAATANTNPIILDSRGMCNIWLLSTVVYKYVVKDADDTLIFTTDNIGVTLTAASFATPPVLGSTTPNSGYLTTLELTATSASTLNRGTTAQRPTGVAGMVRYNTSTGKFEGYNATTWGQLGGGATGGGTDQVFVENGQTVTADYTITTNFNAMSTGPISIADGITVTIPTDSVWVIL